MAYLQKYHHGVDDNMTYIFNIIMVVNDIVISNAALQLLVVRMTTIANVKGRDTNHSTGGCLWGFQRMFIVWNCPFHHFLSLGQDFLEELWFPYSDFIAEFFFAGRSRSILDGSYCLLCMSLVCPTYIR